MSDSVGNLADAKARLALLHEQLGELARWRQEARELGREIPPRIRELIVTTRRLLREAGLSQEMIDTTPGLQIPD